MTKSGSSFTSSFSEGKAVPIPTLPGLFDEEPGIKLSACVYCHNYTKGENEVLYLPKFKENIQKYPVFSKKEIAVIVGVSVVASAILYVSYVMYR